MCLDSGFSWFVLNHDHVELFAKCPPLYFSSHPLAHCLVLGKEIQLTGESLSLSPFLYQEITEIIPFAPLYPIHPTDNSNQPQWSQSLGIRFVHLLQLCNIFFKSVTLSLKSLVLLIIFLYLGLPLPSLSSSPVQCRNCLMHSFQQTFLKQVLHSQKVITWICLIKLY